MADPPTLRKATVADIPSIMALVRIVVPLMEAAGNYQWDREYPNEQVFAHDVENGALWLAESNGRIAGIAAFTTAQEPEYADAGWNAYEPAIVVHRLAVDPAFRGQGVAAALMRQAETVTRESGLFLVRTDTNVVNDATSKLFPKLGYEAAGEINLRFRPGLRFRCYQKRLMSEAASPSRRAIT